MESAGIWAAIAAIVGIVAEVLRRSWKAKDERKAKHEQDVKKRDDDMDGGNLSGVFNSPPRR